MTKPPKASTQPFKNGAFRHGKRRPAGQPLQHILSPRPRAACSGWARKAQPRSSSSMAKMEVRLPPEYSSTQHTWRCTVQPLEGPSTSGQLYKIVAPAQAPPLTGHLRRTSFTPHSFRNGSQHVAQLAKGSPEAGHRYEPLRMSLAVHAPELPGTPHSTGREV